METEASLGSQLLTEPAYPEAGPQTTNLAALPGKRTAVRRTAARCKDKKNMATKPADVPFVSRNDEKGVELIDSSELASRLRVPESWVRNRTRGRTPTVEKIPCIRLGKYVRFAWRSPELQDWIGKQRDP